ncbi:Anti-adapter protein IraP [Sodalis glossinidius str. 'morsitans']|uniref:Anti-adapter protein IraP n=1 Tax=Sodalis glossinidius (strain morsitans) TaxID=343509 RepID=A0A193QGV1_SODGM|nr:Anti-adapter protein IraP [Sodalis glossinidius str. 'morsitans']
MKNLVIDLLIKMAKADVQTKELTAQVEAQSLLLAALGLTVGKGIPASMSSNIQKAILSAPEASAEILSTDADLLLAGPF